MFIHSLPPCHPSTLGGFSKPCPIAAQAPAAAYVSVEGREIGPAIRSVPTTISAGLLIRASREASSLKKSALNIARSIADMSYPDSKYACDIISIASGSFGSKCGHCGTGNSSATKK